MGTPGCTPGGRAALFNGSGAGLPLAPPDRRRIDVPAAPFYRFARMAADIPEVLFERRGAAGIITLNRPQTLNAVTLGMVGALTRQLSEWEQDGAVTRVIITAAGDRAFSAGGDLRALFELGRARNY